MRCSVCARVEFVRVCTVLKNSDPQQLDAITFVSRGEPMTLLPIECDRKQLHGCANGMICTLRNRLTHFRAGSIDNLLFRAD